MRLGVVGAGVMGLGVTQCLIAAGHEVVVVDPSEEVRAAAPARLRDGVRLQALLGGRKASGELPARVGWTGRMADLARVEFVVECAPERLPLKEELFAELDRVCPPGTVLASCTSAIPIARLAAATRRPGEVIGTHFMNPAPLKPAVEVVRGAHTTDDTLARTVDLLTGLGKTAIVVGDAPGFVTNRVLMLTVNQAVVVLHEGTADAATVDRVFETCFGHPMGPLRTADLIGLDTVLDSLVVLRDLLDDPTYDPCPLLVDLVARGRLGRKSGHGFHTWPAPRG